jgi:hypothetical protein
MFLTQFGISILMVALALLPQVMAAFLSGPRVSDSEEYDYR